MYLSYDTFCVYWYPVLMALGIYCLLDGKSSSFSSRHLHNQLYHPHIHQDHNPITIDTFTNYSGIQSSWSLSLKVNHHYDHNHSHNHSHQHNHKRWWCNLDHEDNPNHGHHHHHSKTPLLENVLSPFSFIWQVLSYQLLNYFPASWNSSLMGMIISHNTMTMMTSEESLHSI